MIVRTDNFVSTDHIVGVVVGVVGGVLVLLVIGCVLLIMYQRKWVSYLVTMYNHNSCGIGKLT